MDDRYQVGPLIEELAFGKIYEAEDTLIHRKVEIFRYLLPTSDDDADWKETFNATSAELATAAHPGIPIIYTHGIDEVGPYTIRQLLNTTILNTRLAESGPLSEYEAWELAHQMLEIHDAARPSGNFHGALNANHVGLITRPSGKKLYSISDYGLAEVSRQIHKSTDYMGDSYLISPEQAEGEPASELSQIYAIGQLIFHALAGGHPWIETPLEEIVRLQKSEQVMLISEYNAGVPEAMTQWLAKLMAFAPQDRFQSYEEATAHLPEPIQSAPVPVQATSAIYAVPATGTTATQTVMTGGSGPTSAAEAFAAQQAAAEADKKSSNAAKVKFFKKPLVLGGIGTIILILIAILMFTGEDDGSDDSNYVSDEGSENADVVNLPREGLVAYLDFNDEKLTAANNTLIRLETLLDAAEFSRKGRSGKGLILDKSHYFRLALSGTSMEDSTMDFTISFWIKPLKDQDLAVLSKQPWSEGDSEILKAASESHLWQPNNAAVIGKTWNMVTMVCARSSNTINLYIDDEKVAESSNDEVDEFHNSPFIYLGCDSKQNLLHLSPVIIDNLAIWERALSEFEIKNLSGH